MEMSNTDLRISVLLSFQRALLGMIYPSIRVIAVGFDGLEKLKVVCYLDRVPNEDDYESMQEITSEVFADLEFKSEDIKCVYSSDRRIELENHLTDWVYSRREDFSYYPLLATKRKSLLDRTRMFIKFSPFFNGGRCDRFL